MVNVAFALGGEGSEGYTHLGVIRALERGDFNDEQGFKGIYKEHQSPPGYRVFRFGIPGWGWVDLFILRQRSRDLWIGMYVWGAGACITDHNILVDSGQSSEEKYVGS